MRSPDNRVINNREHKGIRIVGTGDTVGWNAVEMEWCSVKRD